MSSLVLFTFNKVELQVVIDVKEWCWAKKVCNALMYEKKTGNVIQHHCSQENSAHKYQLSGVTATGTPVNWPSHSQKHYLYISEEGLFELVFISQQPLAKSFCKHCCNVRFPHIWQQLLNRVIEEKEAALALLNDELQSI